MRESNCIYRSKFIDLMYEQLGEAIPREKIAIAYDLIVEYMFNKIKKYQTINVGGFGIMYFTNKNNIKILVSDKIKNIFK